VLIVETHQLPSQDWRRQPSSGASVEIRGFDYHFEENGECKLLSISIKRMPPKTKPARNFFHAGRVKSVF
jgi:hypothetical protein